MRAGQGSTEGAEAPGGKLRTDAQSATAGYLAARDDLLRRPGPPGPGRRSALLALTDRWLTDLFTLSGTDKAGAALVAVGGYGRGDLCVGSDLDLLLLQRDSASHSADQIWYPIWDTGLSLDHSVRKVGEARKLAGEDYKVLLGLLDARTIAGDELLTEQLVSSVRSDWRAFAPKRLEEIRAAVDTRRERAGEVAHLLEPDLKESYGGLRDLVILRAIAASWITDVPHSELEAAKLLLLNARDALHDKAPRPTDRLLMQEQIPVANELGLASPDELMRQISKAGRSIAWASDRTWYTANRVTRRSPRRPFKKLLSRPDRHPLAPGVVEQQGEVVLAADAKPAEDPGLVLRAAAAAAHAGLQLTPHAVDRLAKESAPLPQPWPNTARDSFVSLLGAGRAAVTVWESLDQAGIISDIIPYWEVIRSAPQRNPVHRFTVDRHLVETAVAAGRFQREVARPDLLLVAALLHDIGKGRPGTDHTDVGVELVREIAPLMGFNEADSEMIVRLVEFHLLLPEVATRRDPDDPATIELVVSAVQNMATLELLYALTRADAAATGPAAWSDWRQALITDLVNRTRAALTGDEPEALPDLAVEQAEAISAGITVVELSDAAPGDLTRATIVTPDRTGVLSIVAGVLSVNGLNVRASRVATSDGMAISQWWVGANFGRLPNEAKIRSDLILALEGKLDLAARIKRREADYADETKVWALDPHVDVVPEASDQATVVQVRTFDRSGALYRLAGAISRSGADIVAARADTMGSNVIDVFYLTDAQGDVLNEALIQDVVKRLTEAASN
ncbi:MAG: [protein-PII] uridylyltransferase [Actinomycetia bacterium]|nr:[protein-PII] uridylyltransferase [Actinomycetes bacterium]